MTCKEQIDDYLFFTLTGIFAFGYVLILASIVNVSGDPTTNRVLSGSGAFISIGIFIVMLYLGKRDSRRLKTMDVKMDTMNGKLGSIVNILLRMEKDHNSSKSNTAKRKSPI